MIRDPLTKYVPESKFKLESKEEEASKNDIDTTQNTNNNNEPQHIQLLKRNKNMQRTRFRKERGRCLEEITVD